MGWILTGYAVGVLITAVVLARHARAESPRLGPSMVFAIGAMSLVWPMLWLFVLVISVEAPK